ncbi:hypothetical protein ACGC1H_006861 [Rhizoctonia solani]
MCKSGGLVFGVAQDAQVMVFLNARGYVPLCARWCQWMLCYFMCTELVLLSSSPALRFLNLDFTSNGIAPKPSNMRRSRTVLTISITYSVPSSAALLSLIELQRPSK